MSKKYRQGRMYLDETGTACQHESVDPKEEKEARHASHVAYWESLTEDQQELLRRCGELEKHGIYLRGGMRNMWINRFYNTLPGADTTRTPKLAVTAPLILANWDAFVAYLKEHNP